MNTCEVALVTGAGDIGAAVARSLLAGWIPRPASGHLRLVIADRSAVRVNALATQLRMTGHDVVPRVVDVTDREAVVELAQECASAGRLGRLVHTVGASPVTADADADADALRTGLVGTALILEAIGDEIAPGGSGVVVSSAAAGLISPRLTLDDELDIVSTRAEDLCDLPLFRELRDPATLFAQARRANQVQARAAAAAWRRRSARVNSVSPGLLDTVPHAVVNRTAACRLLRDQLGTAIGGQAGRVEDVAQAVLFLTGPRSSYVSGVDLLLDGGSRAIMSPTSRNVSPRSTAGSPG